MCFLSGVCFGKGEYNNVFLSTPGPLLFSLKLNGMMKWSRTKLETEENVHKKNENGARHPSLTILSHPHITLLR